MFSLRTSIAALTLALGSLAAYAPAQSVDVGVQPDAPAAVAEPKQDPAAPSSASGTPVAAPQDPNAGGPDIYLLPDAEGKLRRVLGYRYEDFFQAWQNELALQAEDSQPKVAVDSLRLEGTPDRAAIAAKIMVTVELQSSGWVEAPLGLSNLIIDSVAIEGGAGRDFLTFSAQRGAYAAWLKGEPGSRRTIELKGRIPTERAAEGGRLSVDLPLARTSVVELVVPAELHVETPSAALVTSDMEGDATRWRIEGVKDRFAAVWGRTAPHGPGSSAYEAEIESAVMVDAGRLTYDASIILTGLGSPIERVQIKLPAGSTASSLPNAAGYSVTPVAEGITDESVSVVEVAFDEPSQKPPPVRLAAEQNGATLRGSNPRFSAWEVVGAFRQRGNVAVRLSDQIHAHFERSGRVRQIEPSALPERLRGPEVVAAFETSGAGWGVDVHTQPRQRKVNVTPTYLLHFGAQGAALDLTLDYQISGGRVFELRVDLHGWELTEQPVESGGAVNQREQHVTADNILILPLEDADAQRVRLRLALRRPAGLGVHEIALPEALDAFAAAGDLTVTCDDAWRASALIERSSGVSSVERSVERTPSSPVDRPHGATTAALRLQTFLPQPKIAVEVTQRDQVIKVNSIVNAKLEGTQVNVQQVLDYEILNQPATQLAATVSADLLGNEGLLVTLDGRPLPSAAVDVQPLLPATGAKGEDDLRLIVTLPQPTIGRVRLTIHSQLNLSEPQRAWTAPFALSLAVPDQPAQSSATVSAADDSVVIRLSSAEATSPWTASSSAPSTNTADGDGRRLTLKASGVVRELALALEPVNLRPPVETRVEAAWAQTWVAGGLRQDRLVYRFNTSGSRIAVVLPEDFNEVEVLVDGEVPSLDRTRKGVIAVSLPDDQNSHTLELRRHTPLRIGSWVKQSVSFPRIEGADAWSPFFWQLIMPADVEAMATPSGMSAEYQLGWHGLRWGREPTQTQRDLERWTGATAAPMPSPRTNQYLYSAFQPPAAAEFIAIRRVWVVVAAGLAALGVGLAWLYTSLARSLAFWWVMCVAAAATLFIYPEAAVLLVQAVILGGAFTILSAVIRWLLPDARTRRASTPAAAASSVASLAATQPWVAEPPAQGAAAPSYQSSGSAP